MQIITNDFNSAYCRLGKTLCKDPQYTITNRHGDKVYELVDWSFALRVPSQCFATCRNMSLSYLKGEMEFYLSGSPFLKDIIKYAKFWERCTDDGETITSNYGKLLLHDKNDSGLTQFDYARSCLINNKESKKGVMVIYRDVHAKKSNDNPCTMYLQFFIRNNKLDLFVKMRSSDIWYGLPYDVPFFVYILYKMYHELKSVYEHLDIGQYHHQSGSLHLYKRNREKLLGHIENWESNLNKHLESGKQIDLFVKHILNKSRRM